MPSPLCDACRRINADFFSPAFDNSGSMQGPVSLHLPINWIKRSADAGCPLCTCLIASAQTDWLPEAILETTQVELRRAIIDSQQALSMYVGWDDVSHTSFFRIPSTLCKFFPKLYLVVILFPPSTGTLPCAELGKPCRDIEVMSFWVRDCIQHHLQCARDSAELFVPTRLLDLEAFEGSEDLKLVTFNGKNVAVNYIALSYC